MVKTAVLDLNNLKNQSRWIVGKPPQVPKTSPFYSEQILIGYTDNPERGTLLKREVEHYHTSPVEEYYLVLKGTLKVKVEDAIMVLNPMQLLAVPPNKRHKIVDCSPSLQFFCFRAPVFNTTTKRVTEP